MLFFEYFSKSYFKFGQEISHICIMSMDDSIHQGINLQYIQIRGTLGVSYVAADWKVIIFGSPDLSYVGLVVYLCGLELLYGYLER